jgi:hypothetical protein
LSVGIYMALAKNSLNQKDDKEEEEDNEEED